MSNNVNEIANKKTRKPLAKKEFSLKDFKKKINGEDIPQKELDWIYLGDAWKEQTGLDGATPDRRVRCQSVTYG